MLVLPSENELVEELKPYIPQLLPQLKAEEASRKRLYDFWTEKARHSEAFTMHLVRGAEAGNKIAHDVLVDLAVEAMGRGERRIDSVALASYAQKVLKFDRPSFRPAQSVADSYLRDLGCRAIVKWLVDRYADHTPPLRATRNSRKPAEQALALRLFRSG